MPFEQETLNEISKVREEMSSSRKLLPLRNYRKTDCDTEEDRTALEKHYIPNAKNSLFQRKVTKKRKEE